ncbi:MAG: lysylphosphatidylglycerol synthase transmembrane domain-containing protein [Promethearchaeota archaeon]|jgi:uncharacterized protein (TIRG00374 family)
MNYREPRISLKKGLSLIVVGLFVFALYLHFFVGFEEISQIIKQVDPVKYAPYYSLTFISILLSILFYSMAWRELLKNLSIEIDVKKVFIYVFIANFVDLIIPFEAITVEITRVYLLYKDSKEHVGNVIASVVGHKIISNLFAFSALVVSSVYLIRLVENFFVYFLLLIVIIGTAASIIILLFLSLKQDASIKLVKILIKLVEKFVGKDYDSPALIKRVHQEQASFHGGIKILVTQPGTLSKTIIYTAFSWFSHLVIYFLVFYALGFTRLHLFIPLMIVVFSISVAVQTIPIGLPVGLVEIVMTSLYTVFGVPPAIGGIATTLIRLVTFWFQVLIGYIIIQWMGIKIIQHSSINERASA